jgi:hypothetical protein
MKWLFLDAKQRLHLMAANPGKAFMRKETQCES